METHSMDAGFYCTSGYIYFLDLLMILTPRQTYKGRCDPCDSLNPIHLWLYRLEQALLNPWVKYPLQIEHLWG